jgi:chromosome partitioning protein
MKVIAVVNHKGGVGKTTFAGSTAQALTLLGLRVLAIDNDSQHNCSTMLGSPVRTPTMHELYTAAAADAPALFLQAIRKTALPNLHIVTASSELSDTDIRDELCLKNIMAQCGLARFYDYVIIDNAPGMDRLQAAAIHAADAIFVPTELKQFAVDGIVEMQRQLEQRFGGTRGIDRIVPNFYRPTIRQNTFLAALHQLFPGKVTATAIPLDAVFDELITSGKILFLHRLYSKAAAYYIKLIHELFELDEKKAWEQMVAKRKETFSHNARERFLQTNPFAKSGRPAENAQPKEAVV